MVISKAVVYIPNKFEKFGDNVFTSVSYLNYVIFLL